MQSLKVGLNGNVAFVLSVLLVATDDDDTIPKDAFPVVPSRVSVVAGAESSDDRKVLTGL